MAENPANMLVVLMGLLVAMLFASEVYLWYLSRREGETTVAAPSRHSRESRRTSSISGQRTGAVGQFGLSSPDDLRMQSAESARRAERFG